MQRIGEARGNIMSVPGLKSRRQSLHHRALRRDSGEGLINVQFRLSFSSLLFIRKRFDFEFFLFVFFVLSSSNTFLTLDVTFSVDYLLFHFIFFFSLLPASLNGRAHASRASSFLGGRRCLLCLR